MSEYILDGLVETFQNTSLQSELSALLEQVTDYILILRNRVSFYNSFDGARAMVKYMESIELLERYEKLKEDIKVKLTSGK